MVGGFPGVASQKHNTRVIHARLQHLDAEGALLLDMVEGENPVECCMNKFHAMLFTQTSEIIFVVTHFASQPEVLRNVLDNMYLVIMSMSALLWWRFAPLADTWPFRLLRLMKDDPVKIAEALYAEPSCCLGGSMAMKIRSMFETLAQLASDEDFAKAIRQWGKTVRLSNMHTERQLALLKRAGGSHKPPLLERFAADGTLQQHVSKHRSLGGGDPCTQSRET